MYRVPQGVYRYLRVVYRYLRVVYLTVVYLRVVYLTVVYLKGWYPRVWYRGVTPGCGTGCYPRVCTNQGANPPVCVPTRVLTPMVWATPWCGTPPMPAVVCGTPPMPAVVCAPHGVLPPGCAAIPDSVLLPECAELNNKPPGGVTRSPRINLGIRPPQGCFPDTFSFPINGYGFSDTFPTF